MYIHKGLLFHSWRMSLWELPESMLTENVTKLGSFLPNKNVFVMQGPTPSHSQVPEWPEWSHFFFCTFFLEVRLVYCCKGPIFKLLQSKNTASKWEVSSRHSRLVLFFFFFYLVAWIRALMSWDSQEREGTFNVIEQTPPSQASLWEHPSRWSPGVLELCPGQGVPHPRRTTHPFLDNSNGGQILPQAELKSFTL